MGMHQGIVRGRRQRGVGETSTDEANSERESRAKRHDENTAGKENERLKKAEIDTSDTSKLVYGCVDTHAAACGPPYLGKIEASRSLTTTGCAAATPLLVATVSQLASIYASYKVQLAHINAC